MRQALCAGCGKQYETGTREIYAKNDIGEPAEWARVMRGLANTPTPRQRTMTVNGAAFPLPIEHFDCDFCGTALMPGTPIVCVTVWQPERQQEPPIWETDYLEPQP